MTCHKKAVRPFYSCSPIVTTIANAWMNTLERAEATDAARTPADEVLRLFHEHGSAIYRFCRSTLRSDSDAEDVVQETFLKLLQHLESRREGSNLKSWLFTVAANACRDRAHVAPPIVGALPARCARHPRSRAVARPMAAVDRRGRSPTRRAGRG
jgi:hypothetical protein